MNKKVKILHLENSLKDSETIKSAIKGGEIEFDYFYTDNEKEYLNILEKENIDVILSDFSLRDYNGNEALKIAREKYAHIPFIFVSGALGEEIAVNSMINGAIDYVLKNKLERLVPAIKRGLSLSENEFRRKQAEKALRESEEKFRSYVEYAPDGVFTIDDTGRYIDVNKSCCQITGYSKEELEQMSFQELLAEESPENGMAIFEKLLGTGAYTTDVWLKKKDGSKYCLTLAAVRLSTSRFLVFAKDITQRKRAEDALLASQQVIEGIINAIPVRVFWKDRNLVYLGCNKVFAHDAGFADPKEILGKDDYQMSWRPQADLYRGDDRQVIESGCPKLFIEEPQLTPDGNTITLLTSKIPLRNSQGEISGVLGTYLDISERKKAEAKLQELNETLEQRVAERTDELEIVNRKLEFHIKEIEQFTYMASHDLQEPLRTMTSFAQLMKDDYAVKLDEDGNKYIEFIYNSAVRMRDLVKGLLDYSVLGKDRMTTNVDCNEIVDEVLSDIGDSLKECHAIVKADKLPTINGYSTELRLLFQNLINNAIKFKKKEISPEINISVVSHEKEWIFSIEDNGIGIDKKNKEKIFIMFQRMHTRREYEGSGIGLAHCKKIVELHGGEIWVESMPGEGSVFMFTIPKR